jgi:hypothetical protein
VIKWIYGRRGCGQAGCEDDGPGEERDRLARAVIGAEVEVYLLCSAASGVPDAMVLSILNARGPTWTMLM